MTSPLKLFLNPSLVIKLNIGEIIAICGNIDAARTPPNIIVFPFIGSRVIAYDVNDATVIEKTVVMDDTTKLLNKYRNNGLWVKAAIYDLIVELLVNHAKEPKISFTGFIDVKNTHMNGNNTININIDNRI